MPNNSSDLGGRKNRDPFALKSPEEIARLGLTFGYEHDQIVDTVAKQCNLTASDARRIVEGVAQKQSERSQH